MRTILVCALAATALPVFALADDDSASCTTKPQSAWMKPEAAASKIEEAGYSDVRNIKVAGSCYEIYAFTAKHQRAEVYMNPVTAEIVKAEVDD
ncbi:MULTISPECIES: PepSY domain-containing protein [unclassified Sinorhizobium]|uniref:PepSY domain-containing protein n=1 Tax=unclassified Sinorhizobium TaxID=2613772 RepID=UPI0024C35E8F|nr:MULTISPECIES: PepSY domain-containing protein [unclassified Sinorhizobium]MDK1373819.1 PepSY domain-containing protein [Sinorhizobium sp. 6-70]MDK1481780.1 PepSY domain-containing protein [Sinorhizobium sp. 6-117]